MSTEPSPSPTTSETPSPTAACACVSRRHSLAVAGLAAAGTAALAACGSATTARDAVSSAASAATSAAASVAGDAIKAADVPVGGGKVFEALKVVVTQPTAGDFKAFSAVCPHQGCTVSDVTNGVITCPCHGSQFDAATGAVKQGPATAPLPPKTVSVSAGGLTVS